MKKSSLRNSWLKWKGIHERDHKAMINDDTWNHTNIPRDTNVR